MADYVTPRPEPLTGGEKVEICIFFMSALGIFILGIATGITLVRLGAIP